MSRAAASLCLSDEAAVDDVSRNLVVVVKIRGNESRERRQKGNMEGPRILELSPKVRFMQTKTAVRERICVERNNEERNVHA